jgi:hypothetical protein
MTRPSRQAAKVAVAVAIVVLLAVVSTLVWVAFATLSVVHGHNAEIQQTHALSVKASTNHNQSVQYLVALCESTPGCPAAYAATVAKAKEKK